MNNTEKIIQISSGKGPAECCWVVSQLLKVFITEAKAQNILVKTISRVKGEENRTLNSVTLLVKGNNTDSFLIDWLGTIQWVGKSMFRKYHKRKNWFIGVSEFKTTKKINWNEKDIRFETFRSSGAGGQHVNKVESAVRAIHIPTGTSSTARDSRSQYQNKKIVIERLREVLEKNQFNTINNELNMQWMGHNTLERGNPIRIYTGEHFKRKN